MKGRPNITLKQLEIFQAIVVAGSFTKAVSLTDLSQPTLSQQLANLELELGVQLLSRGKKSQIELTPAGEFWLGRSKQLLNYFESSIASHRETFLDNGISVTIGTTPSLQGRFDELVALAALRQPKIKSLSIRSFLNSKQVVDALTAHRINLAVGSKIALDEQKNSLIISKLYDDPIVWAVPISVPVQDVIRALHDEQNVNGHICFNKHVLLMPTPPWHRETLDWYRNRLPCSEPYFQVSTHQAALSLAASGSASCHVPMSQIPNIVDEVSNRLRYFSVGHLAREVCLAYPKHLKSMPSFLEFTENIGGILQDEQANSRPTQIFELPELVSNF